jgi:hypothetical protein
MAWELLFLRFSARFKPHDGRKHTNSCNFQSAYALGSTSSGMAVMRGDRVIVGSKAAKSASIIVEDPPDEKLVPAERHPAIKDVCGAMSLQRCDSASQSTPQKFVRLVGCRNPRIKPPTKRTSFLTE